jgi:hypothetical protein
LGVTVWGGGQQTGKREGRQAEAERFSVLLVVSWEDHLPLPVTFLSTLKRPPPICLGVYLSHAYVCTFSNYCLKVYANMWAVPHVPQLLANGTILHIFCNFLLVNILKNYLC